MKNNSLKKLTLLYSLGNLSAKILNFGLIFVLTYYYSQEEVGEYDLVMTILSLAIPVVSLQLFDSVLRWVIEDRSLENLQNVFTNTLIIQLINIVLTGICLSLLNLLIEYEYLILLFILTSLNSILYFFQYFLRGLKKNEIYVLSSIGYSVFFSFSSVIGIIFFDVRIFGLLIVNIISTFLILVSLFIVGNFKTYLKIPKLSFNFSTLLISYSLHLIPNAISWWLIVSANRLIIASYLGSASNGLYSVAFKFPTLIMLLIQTFQLAWQEKAIENFADAKRDAYYSSVLEKYVIILFLLSILFLFFNKFLVRNLVNVNFFDAWKYVPFLMLGIIFSSISGFLGSIFLSLKQTNKIFYSSFVGGIISVILAFYIIPKFGLFGASYSLIIGFFSLMMIRIILVKEVTKIKFPFRVGLELCLLYLIIMFFGLTQVDFGLVYGLLFFLVYIIFKRNLFIKIFSRYEK